MGNAGDREVVTETSEIRTSETTWCDTPECLAEPAVRAVYDRVEDVSSVPRTNYEYLQLLRYKPCPHAAHSSCQFCECRSFVCV